MQSGYFWLVLALAAACVAEQPQLALLWLLRDRINHDEFWESYIKRLPAKSVRMYFHLSSSTEQSQLPRFFQARGTFVPSSGTKWKTFSIVKAMNRLVREALRDPNNKRFVFLSESCIPLKPPHEVYQQIMFGKKSVEGVSEFCFGSRAESRTGWAIIKSKAIKATTRDLVIANEASFNPERTYLKKSYQWCVLSRNHAELLTSQTPGADTELDVMVGKLGLDLLGEGDEGGGASDEHAYVSCGFDRSGVFQPLL
jgi:hypothetical protein